MQGMQVLRGGEGQPDLGRMAPCFLGEPHFAGLHYKLIFGVLNTLHEWDKAMGGWKEIPCFAQEWESVQGSPCIAASGDEENCVFPFMALVLQVLD